MLVFVSLVSYQMGGWLTVTIQNFKRSPKIFVRLRGISKLLGSVSANLQGIGQVLSGA